MSRRLIRKASQRVRCHPMGAPRSARRGGVPEGLDLEDMGRLLGVRVVKVAQGLTCCPIRRTMHPQRAIFIGGCLRTLPAPQAPQAVRRCKQPHGGGMAATQQQGGKTAVQMKQAPQPGPLTPPVTLLLGDCREQLPRLAADSVDLAVTSPPYANQRAATYGGVRPDA